MKIGRGNSALRRLMAFLKPFRASLLMVLATAVIGTAFQIVAPKLIGIIVSELFDGAVQGARAGTVNGIDVILIFRIIVSLTVLYLLSSAFSYVQQLMAGNVTQRIVYDLRMSVHEKLARLPLRFYDSRSRGDVLSRAVNDVDNIGNMLNQVISQLLVAVMTIVGITVMMLTIDPLLTLVVIATLPLSYVGMKMIASRSMPHFKNYQMTLGELSGQVEETYAGHTIVKAYGSERRNIGMFRAINERLYESGRKAQFISGFMMPLITIVNNLSFILICIVGGLSVARGSIKVGDVQAFIQYARTFSQPLIQVANIANMIQSGIASAERIFELLDEPDEIPDAAYPLRIAKPRGDVRFEGVHFRYKEDVPLIDGMDIQIKKGQTVAIVGPTGAGKSTIVNLLLRFYELDSGRITIDGVAINELSRGDLRSLFAMVLQETWLFTGTIKQNLAYGKADAKDEDIVRAAHAANADAFIRKLPEGYDTLLNEDGDILSQGQKQLLAIARALLADPAILILDEATSSVDTRTEAKIQQAMSHLMEGRTSFVIAHRLSTIRDADIILVMDKGRIVEHGDHERLLKQDGYYAELYNSQFLVGDSAVG
jgi:ATP-binding cassette subfamily B multidrug efflux pump